MASAATLGLNNDLKLTTTNEFKLNDVGQNELMIQKRKLESKIAYFQGWCEVKIFRRNGDGTTTLVAYSLTIVDSEAACDAKFGAMMFEQQMKELTASIN